MSKPLPARIVLATANPGKVREFTSSGETLPFELLPQSDFGVDAPEETGLTFVENALLKARYAAKATGLPAIADDSGLIIDALHGAPGLYSARYAGENATRQQKLDKILHELDGVPLEKRTARCYCALVFISRWDNPLPIITEGWWEGQILLAAQGMNGFGFEPIFYVSTHRCSAGDISIEEKMRISHRGQAWQKMLVRLSKGESFSS